MAALLALVLAIAAAAGPSRAPADLEREARALETELIAPCCFTQQVSVHQSDAATAVRRDIRVRLAAGETRQQILDAYTRQYGKRILAQPPAEGFDRALYVVPAIILPVSIVLVVLMLGRFSRTSRHPAPDAVPATAARREDEARLDTALRELD